MRRKLILFLFILSLFLTVAGKVSSEDASKSVNPEQVVTAGDHAELANYYKSQAEARRQIAEMHDKMKVSYRNSHVHYKGTENALAGQCGELKFQALKMAEKCDAMAKEEAKLVGQPNH